MAQISLTVQEKDGRTSLAQPEVERVLLAGYTGRDRAGVAHRFGYLT